MPLNPQDIVRKEFREAFRGYQQTDVDLFLDEVVDDFTRLIDENQKMRVRLAALQQELARYRDARSVRAQEQMATRYGADQADEPAEQPSRRLPPPMAAPKDPFGPTSADPRPRVGDETQPHGKPEADGERWQAPPGSERPFWGGD